MTMMATTLNDENITMPVSKSMTPVASPFRKPLGELNGPTSQQSPAINKMNLFDIVPAKNDVKNDVTKEEEEAVTRALLISAIQDTRELKVELNKNSIAQQGALTLLQSNFDDFSRAGAKASAFQVRFAAETTDIKERVEKLKSRQAGEIAHHVSTPERQKSGKGGRRKTPVSAKGAPRGPHLRSTRKQKVSSFAAYANEKSLEKVAMQANMRPEPVPEMLDQATLVRIGAVGLLVVGCYMMSLTM